MNNNDITNDTANTEINNDILTDEDFVDIICPECHNHVVIGSDNKCPNCGCEFEEVQKKYRLTKFGIFCGITSSIVYMFILVFLKFIDNPDKLNQDSLFYMDAFRNINAFSFVVSLIFSVVIIAMFFVISIYDSRIINAAAALLAAVLSFAILLFLFYSEGTRTFFLFTKIVFLLPLIQIFSSLLCLIDIFIKPKSKL